MDAIKRNRWFKKKIKGIRKSWFVKWINLICSKYQHLIKNINRVFEIVNIRERLINCIIYT